jgi:fermentation-respiration switch protein FrsA (DUF1100 family)
MTNGRALVRGSGLGPLARLAGDAFENLSRIEQMRSPLLIIHGTHDDVIPFSMGRQLYDKAPYPKQFISLENSGHNDISIATTQVYREGVRRFIRGLNDD